MRIFSKDVFLEKINSEVEKSDDVNKIVDSQMKIRRFFGEEQSLGNVLQRRLEDSVENEKIGIYNPYRAVVPDYEDIPQIISLNWWSKFNDIKLSSILLRRPPPEDVYTRDQLTRATEFIWNLLEFKKIVDEGRLYAEEDGTIEEKLIPYYNRIFCSEEQLENLETDKSRDILVLAKDRLFLLRVINPDGSFVRFKAINRGLYKVCDLSLHSPPLPSIPLLSTASPKIWREALKELENASERNSTNLKNIKRCLFAVCLDSYSSHKRDDISIHQFSSNFDCGNRWFDKPLEIVVNNSARSGLCANLKYLDVQATSRIINYIIANEQRDHHINKDDNIEIEIPRALEWDTNDAIAKLIEDTKEDIRKHVYPIEAAVHNTNYYGKSFMHQIAKADPDAMVMMAICLAWYRVMNTVPYTAFICNSRRNGVSYPVLTRIPKNLVTEFIESFDDDNVLYESKLALFKNAEASIRDIKEQNIIFPDKIEYADSLVNQVVHDSERSEADSNIVKTVIYDTRKIDVLAANFHKNHLFTSGISIRHNKSCTISYHITDHTISFTLSSTKNHVKELCFELRRELDRAIKEMLIIFPLRSDIWGKHWRIEKQMVERETALLQTHRILSNRYINRREVVEKRFEKFNRPLGSHDLL